MGRKSSQRETGKKLELAVAVSSLGLNCRDCSKNKDLQKHRGCINPTERIQYIFDGKEMYRCPAKFIMPEVKLYIEMYSQYKKGLLPFRGTVSEQPIKLMDIFDILESAEANAEKERIKRLNG